MNSMLLSLILAFFFIPSTEAKIIWNHDEFFIETNKAVAPIFAVNMLIKKNQIKKIKIYANGNIHLLSFAKEGEPEILYSVDVKGFIYAIKPFSSYTVSKVEDDGKFQFKEKPGLKYEVTANGFFQN